MSAPSVIAVRTSRMLNGTAFKRVPKSLEHLYYLALFSGPDYAGDAGWKSWLAEGTNLGVKAAPHAVADADVYRFSIHSGARDVTVTFSGNQAAADALVKVAEAVSRLLPAVAGKPDADRAAALLADPVVSELVAGPVSASLNKGSLEPADADHIRGVLAKSLEWLTNDQITSLDTNATPAAVIA